MGRETRNEIVHAHYPRRIGKEAVKDTVLEKHAVEQILDARHGPVEADPVEGDAADGIRNASLVGLVIWLLLALAFVYIR